MTGRVLTQVTISFLLGITGSCYGSLWNYVAIAVWLVWLSISLYCRQGKKSKAMVDKGKSTYHLLWIVLIVVNLIFIIFGHIRYNRQQQEIISIEKYLSLNKKATVAGTISKKEEKEFYHIYYLKNSYIIQNEDYHWCNQLLVHLEKDEYSIGDTILVKGNCESFNKACNEGNFDEENYYYSKNMFFRVKGKRIELIEKAKYPWRERLYQLRKQIQQVYNQHLSEKEAGVLGVMTLGEKSMLDTEVKKLYQQSGISHVLAISGLHISILGMSIYRFLRKRKLSYLSSGLAAGLLVLVFGEISGMELSTRRAVLMFLVMLLGNVLGMAYDSVTALSLSAFMQLWENPLAFQNTGFLFSYSAVLAVVVATKIILGNKKEEEAEKGKREQKKEEQDKQGGKETKVYERAMKIFRKWGKTMLETMVTSSCIQLVTLPLTLYFYYEFPLYSVIINGMVLPFMGVVLLSGILGGVAGLFSQGVSWILLCPAKYLLNWNEKICGWFQHFPQANWITGKPTLKIMVGYYIFLVLILAILYGINNREENVKKITNSSKRIDAWSILRTTSIAGLFLALALLVIVAPERESQICFLDVGQGDGICMQTSEAVFFLDGGSTSEKGVGEYRILPFLKYRGIQRIDGWFVSHADADHISGLLEILQAGYPVEKLFMAEKIVRDEAWEELCALAGKNGTEIIYLESGDCVGTEEIRLTCLFPKETCSDKNDASMVLQLEMAGITGLFTGDISTKQEQKLLQEYPRLQADFYKAAHHGSNHSNGKAFLEQIRPAVTVVSCSEDNSYGHPGEDAVARMEAVGSEIFYTMESGQVTVQVKEGEMEKYGVMTIY